METVQIILFITGIFALFMKAYYSYSLFLRKYPKWNFKSPILTFIYCNPFTPIHWGMDLKKEKIINNYVKLFYCSFILLTLLVCMEIE